MHSGPWWRSKARGLGLAPGSRHARGHNARATCGQPMRGLGTNVITDIICAICAKLCTFMIICAHACAVRTGVCCGRTAAHGHKLWPFWLIVPFYAQNYAQNYALIMQNYALVIMLYAQLCKRDLLMHRTMTNYAHYVTIYAIICPSYAQLCTIMLKLCPKLCIIMPRNVQWEYSGP